MAGVWEQWKERFLQMGVQAKGKETLSLKLPFFLVQWLHVMFGEVGSHTHVLYSHLEGMIVLTEVM